jgi:hypothetical protein
MYSKYLLIKLSRYAWIQKIIKTAYSKSMFSLFQVYIVLKISKIISTYILFGFKINKKKLTFS